MVTFKPGKWYKDKNGAARTRVTVGRGVKWVGEIEPGRHEWEEEDKVGADKS